MNKRSTPFLSLLLEDLSDPAEAASYLTAAWLDSTQMFLTAVKDVLQAHHIADVARKSGVAREHLYRTFTKKGNPTIATLRSVLSALGLGIPGISTLEDIAAASSNSPSSTVTKQRRATKSRRLSAGNVAQYTLPFDSVAAAQSANTQGPLALATKAAADNGRASASTRSVAQQNQQPSTPPAWMIPQFFASTPNIPTKVI